MFISETHYRVIYGDVDQMGYVYYGNYGRIYEIARVEALRQVGLTYKYFEDNGVMMPVYENKSRYIQPAKYDDLLLIRTVVRELPKTRMYFEYEIYNESQVLLNRGETTVVFVRMDTLRPCLAPQTMLDKMMPCFNQRE